MNCEIVNGLFRRSYSFLNPQGSVEILIRMVFIVTTKRKNVEFARDSEKQNKKLPSRFQSAAHEGASAGLNQSVLNRAAL